MNILGECTGQGEILSQDTAADLNILPISRVASQESHPEHAKITVESPTCAEMKGVLLLGSSSNRLHQSQGLSFKQG